MNHSKKYICSTCFKEHEEWPALAFGSPDNYEGLSEIEKADIAELDSDFCIITYPDQTDKFIRCVLHQNVNDSCQDLDYGLWVSVSENSFEDYSTNFKGENHGVTYFGWLCNEVPGYKFDKSIPTTVITGEPGQRPEIVPHKDFEHPFVYDYYNGITREEAERRIQSMLEIVNDKENSPNTESLKKH